MQRWQTKRTNTATSQGTPNKTRPITERRRVMFRESEKLAIKLSDVISEDFSLVIGAWFHWHCRGWSWKRKHCKRHCRQCNNIIYKKNAANWNGHFISIPSWHINVIRHFVHHTPQIATPSWIEWRRCSDIFLHRSTAHLYQVCTQRTRVANRTQSSHMIMWHTSCWLS